MQEITRSTDIAAADKAMQEAFTAGLEARTAEQRTAALKVLKEQNTLLQKAEIPRITQETNSFTDETLHVFTDPITAERVEFENEESALEHWRNYALNAREEEIDLITEAARVGAVDFLTGEGMASEGTRVEDVGVTMTPERALKAGIISKETLAARIELFALQEGLTPQQAAAESGNLTIKARSFSEQARDGQFRYTVELYRGANIMDVFEDLSEDSFARALDAGFADGEILLDDVRRYEDATGQTLLPASYTYSSDNRLALMEALSALSRAHLLGNVRADTLPPEIAKWVELNTTIYSQTLLGAQNLSADINRAGILKDAIKAGNVSPRLERLIADSIGINSDALEQRLTKRMEEQLAAEAMGGFPEISETARGMIPHPDTMQAKQHPLAGEVRRLWESLKKSTRRKTKGGKAIDRTNEANAFFLPAGEYVDIDKVREVLNQKGFEFDTPADLLDALDTSISYGKPVYGTNSVGDDSFSIGKFEERDTTTQVSFAIGASVLAHNAALRTPRATLMERINDEFGKPITDTIAYNPEHYYRYIDENGWRDAQEQGHFRPNPTEDKYPVLYAAKGTTAARYAARYTVEIDPSKTGKWGEVSTDKYVQGEIGTVRLDGAVRVYKSLPDGTHAVVIDNIGTPPFLEFNSSFSIGRAIPRTAKTFEEARESARSFIGKPIVNADDNTVATISANSLRKILHEKASSKSVSPEVHSLVTANLDTLFERAIRTHSDTNPDGDNMKARHRYHAPFISGGEVMLAKITLNEFKEESDGTRIYSVEAMEIVKPAIFKASSISEDRRNYNRVAGFEEKLESRIAEVNNQPSVDSSFSIGRATVTATPETQTFQGAEGSPSVIGPASFSIGAFHGTPHQVDKFSTEKIGTGEGAQAFGWGLYFAKAKAVAEEYRKGLSSFVAVDGKPIHQNNKNVGTTGDSGLDDLLIANMGDLDAAIKDAQDGLEDYIPKLEALRGRVDRSTNGNLYTVNLDVNDEDLLDWDKPLSEQSKKVRAKLEKKFDSDYGVLGRLNSTGKRIGAGSSIYDLAQNYYLGNTDNPAKAASEFFAALGILGIRYLDGNSRAGGRLSYQEGLPEGWGYYQTQQGWGIKDAKGLIQTDVGTTKEAAHLHLFGEKPSHNYVIFDESKIQITEENGTPVEIGGEASFSIGRAVQIAKQLDKTAKIAEEDFFKTFWPRMMKLSGQNLKASTRNINEAAKRAVADIGDWVKINPKFQNYYNEDWKNTRDILDDSFDNFTDDLFKGFRLFTGLTSPSTPLDGNMSDAVQLMNLWIGKGSLLSMTLKKSDKGNRAAGPGPFPLRSNTGATKIFSLHAVEKLFRKFGDWEKTVQFLNEPVSVKELHAFNKEMGYAGSVGGIGNIRRVVKEATGQDELIPRMFIFGQKVGAYTLNTVGDSRYTTTDIWESRYIRSYFPEMFKTSDGLPVNEDEHTIFQRFASAFNAQFEAQYGVKLENSALQAVRWFYMLAHAKEAGYRYARTNETISGYTHKAVRNYLRNDPQNRGRGGEGSGGSEQEVASFSIGSFHKSLIDRIGEKELRLEQPKVSYEDKSQLLLDLSKSILEGGDGEVAASTEGLAQERGLRGRIGNAAIIRQRLARDLETDLQVRFIGETIGSPEELAVKAQSLRNPRFETFYLLATKTRSKRHKGGAGYQILDSMAITSRVPSSAAIFAGGKNTDEGMAEHLAFLQAAKADSYFLIHNHPSGDPSPSSADLRITLRHSQEMKKHGIRMVDHVVINHSSFATIDEVGVVNNHRIPEQALREAGKEVDPYAWPSRLIDKANDLGREAVSPDQVASIARDIEGDRENPNYILGFITTARGAIASTFTGSAIDILQINKDLLASYTLSQGGAFLLLHAKASSRQEAERIVNNFHGMNRDNMLTDIIVDYVDENGRNWYESGMASGIFSPTPAFYGLESSIVGERVQEGEPFDFKADMKAQGRWLVDEARKMGYSNADELNAADFAAFTRLAVQWRKDHPRGTGSDSGSVPGSGERGRGGESQGGEVSFSIGPAKVAGILSDNALARITDPRRRTYVMSKISRDFNALRLQIERISSLAGIRRSKGDLSREAMAREDLAAEEKIAAIHARFGSLLADEDLVKIKSQPVQMLGNCFFT